MNIVINKQTTQTNTLIIESPDNNTFLKLKSLMICNGTSAGTVQLNNSTTETTSTTSILPTFSLDANAIILLNVESLDIQFNKLYLNSSPMSLLINYSIIGEG